MFSITLVRPTVSAGVKTANWAMVWKDHTGKRHKLTTSTPKKALARDIAAAHKAKLLKDHERRIKQAFGLIDQYEEQLETRLDQLLTKYEKFWKPNGEIRSTSPRQSPDASG